MENLITGHEAALRLTAFLFVFVAVALAEVFLPMRPLLEKRPRRWGRNLALVVINTLTLRLLFPLLAAGAALVAHDHGWGLLNQFEGPAWFKLIIALLVFDVLIYAQHVAFHKIPWLWRVHRVHHADRDIDLTTGARFHPVEIVLSMVFKMVIVVVLGPSAAAVILFEIILSSAALFNHANLALPKAFDSLLRLVLVTPDMHRVHHSVIRAETDSNYGFNLPWWDRLFGTYRAQPKKGHKDMVIGLPDRQDANLVTFTKLVALPFITGKKEREE